MLLEPEPQELTQAKELNIKEAIAYLAERGRVITPRRLQSICALAGTDRQIIAARHSNPASRRRGEWYVLPSELDKLVERGNKAGNPVGFNPLARTSRWSPKDKD